MSNPQVIVDFVANTAGLAGGMKQAGAGAQGFGSKLKGLARAGVVAGGAAGLAALTGTLKVGIDELTQSSKVAAQTAAVIKSTGGAAGVTAKQVSDLAGSMMKKTGIDDEAIQSGENLLLTFTKVQNKAGKGNDIFNRATHVMADMSVALGQDMKTSAVQLGKALNDPIKGVTALQRVGVTFTAAQKKQIKAMVDSGNTMGAQKLILGELNKEFGGSAEAAGKTLPGQINILKESFSNLAGELVSALVPALTDITKFFVDHPKLAKTLVLAILAVSAAFVVLSAALVIGPAISAIVAGIGFLITAFGALAIMLGITQIALFGIVIAIVAAVALVVAGAILLWKNWDTVTKALAAAWDWMKSIAVAAFTAVQSTITSVWNSIRSAITSAVNAVTGVITSGWNAIRSVSSSVWNAIRSVISGVWSAITSTASGAVGAITGAISAGWNAVRSVTSSVWSAIRNTVSDVIGSVRSLISGLSSWLAGAAHGAISGALNAIKSTFHAIAAGAEDAVGAVKGAINSLVGWIKGIAGSVGSAASSVANAIKGPINAVLSAWNSISLTIPHITIPSVKILGKKIGGGSFGGGTIGFPNVPLLAKGAVVDQATLAVVGEGQGRELVTPESLLRDMLAEARPNVRVFIGDTELRGLVRTEVVDVNTGIARTLLAGGA